MKKGEDVSVTFPGLYLVHHNLPGKEVELHSHKEHLLFLPLRGEISVDTGKQILAIGPGKMIYLPPETSHAFQSSTVTGERLIALFGAKAWKAAKGIKATTRVLPVSQLTKELFFYLLLNPKTRNAGALVTVLTQTLSEMLLEAPTQNGVIHLGSKVRDTRLARAIDFIEMESETGKISVPKAAKHAGLSTRTFSRLFLKEMGMSPGQYLIRQKMHRAMQLLKQGQLSVTEVSLEVGYDSLSQFIRTFQAVTGALPSEVKSLS